MNASEAAKVLTAAALVDKRTVGEADARMWAEILPEFITADEAIEAVKLHYRDSRDWIMPSDIVSRMGAVKAERVRRAGPPNFPDELDVGKEFTWRRRWVDVLSVGGSVEDAENAADAAVDLPPRHGGPAPLELTARADAYRTKTDNEYRAQINREAWGY